MTFERENPSFRDLPKSAVQLIGLFNSTRIKELETLLIEKDKELEAYKASQYKICELLKQNLRTKQKEKDGE